MTKFNNLKATLALTALLALQSAHAQGVAVPAAMVVGAMPLGVTVAAAMAVSGEVALSAAAVAVRQTSDHAEYMPAPGQIAVAVPMAVLAGAVMANAPAPASLVFVATGATLALLPYQVNAAIAQLESGASSRTQ